MTRAFVPGDVVHVGSRGVDRRTIFESDEDRAEFMHLLRDAVRGGRIRCPISSAYIAGCTEAELAEAASCSIRTVERHRPDKNV